MDLLVTGEEGDVGVEEQYPRAWHLSSVCASKVDTNENKFVEVVNTNCPCARGKWKCHHQGALLFALKDLRETCTEKQMQWHRNAYLPTNAELKQTIAEQYSTKKQLSELEFCDDDIDRVKTARGCRRAVKGGTPAIHDPIWYSSQGRPDAPEITRENCGKDGTLWTEGAGLVAMKKFALVLRDAFAVNREATKRNHKPNPELSSRDSSHPEWRHNALPGFAVNVYGKHFQPHTLDGYSRLVNVNTDSYKNVGFNGTEVVEDAPKPAKKRKTTTSKAKGRETGAAAS